MELGSGTRGRSGIIRNSDTVTSLDNRFPPRLQPGVGDDTLPVPLQKDFASRTIGARADAGGTHWGRALGKASFVCESRVSNTLA